jgi:hypothetical protein
MVFEICRGRQSLGRALTPASLLQYLVIDSLLLRSVKGWIVDMVSFVRTVT